MGIQASLDGLIAHHVIAPMIVVMVQDAPGLNNWRDLGTRHSETYVVEVQELVDRMFRTDPHARRAGDRGQLDGRLRGDERCALEPAALRGRGELAGLLRRPSRIPYGDRSVISRLGLHAFLYGASEDPVAVPARTPNSRPN